MQSALKNNQVKEQSPPASGIWMERGKVCLSASKQNLDVEEGQENLQEAVAPADIGCNKNTMRCRQNNKVF